MPGNRGLPSSPQLPPHMGCVMLILSWRFSPDTLAAEMGLSLPAVGMFVVSCGLYFNDIP